MHKKIKIFVGFDQKEAIAYHTFCQSLIEHSSVPVQITPLALKNLNQYSEAHNDRSNDFVYSRFITPFLNEFLDWAIFVDGDMIIQADIKELYELRENI
jgi:lipopolysaccharide biosynthesis glycosyltransferase